MAVTSVGSNTVIQIPVPVTEGTLKNKPSSCCADTFEKTCSKSKPGRAVDHVVQKVPGKVAKFAASCKAGLCIAGSWMKDHAKMAYMGLMNHQKTIAGATFSGAALLAFALNAVMPVTLGLVAGGVLVVGGMAAWSLLANRKVTAGVKAPEFDLTDDAPPRVVEPEAVTPEVVIPEAVTPEVVTPEAVTPEAVTDKVVTPEVVTPEVVTDEAVTDEVVTPEAVTDEAVTDEVVTPEVVTDEAVTDEVVTPEVVTDEAVTDEVVTPEVVTDEAVTDEVVTPEVVTDEAVTDEAVTDEAVTPKVTTPEVIIIPEAITPEG